MREPPALVVSDHQPEEGSRGQVYGPAWAASRGAAQCPPGRTDPGWGGPDRPRQGAARSRRLTSRARWQRQPHGPPLRLLAPDRLSLARPVRPPSARDPRGPTLPSAPPAPADLDRGAGRGGARAPRVLSTLMARTSWSYPCGGGGSACHARWWDGSSRACGGTGQPLRVTRARSSSLTSWARQRWRPVWVSAPMGPCWRVPAVCSRVHPLLGKAVQPALRVGYAPAGSSAGRLYFLITSTRRSGGNRWAVMPSLPVIVSAESRQLRIASSVASTVASKMAVM